MKVKSRSALLRMLLVCIRSYLITECIECGRRKQNVHVKLLHLLQILAISSCDQNQLRCNKPAIVIKLWRLIKTTIEKETEIAHNLTRWRVGGGDFHFQKDKNSSLVQTYAFCPPVLQFNKCQGAKFFTDLQL